MFESLSPNPASKNNPSRVDRILTNRFLGLPIFALVMFLAFQLTFLLGNPIVAWLDRGKTALAAAVWNLGGSHQYAVLVKGLLADGIIEGVGAVLQFVPLIVLMFLCLSILEDSGYMARGAMVLGRLTQRLGLPGKSFIPMLIGFGCTVPAVLATRMLSSRRDRLATMMVLPLISCGARLPVYLLILGAFFADRVIFQLFGLIDITYQAMLLFLIYAIGIGLAVLLMYLLRSTLLRGNGLPFEVDLPLYRLPHPRGVVIQVAQRTWMYLRKAGTIILGMVVLLWALKTYPPLPAERVNSYDMKRSLLLSGGLDSQDLAGWTKQVDLAQHREQIENSLLGRIGRGLEPALAPCGFDWKIAASLLGSLATKEVFVSQLGVIYAVGEHDQGATLQQKLAEDYTPLQGFCVMLFCLIFAPCMGTVAVTMKESASWKWALLQWGGLTILAWVVTAIVYQTATRLF